MAVAMARHRRLRLFAAPGLRRAAARVALARQRRLEFRLQKLFDEGPDTRAHSGLQWIKPVLAEKKLRLGRRLGLECGICCHGMISAGAPTPVIVFLTNQRLPRPPIPTTAPTPPQSHPWDLHGTGR